MSEDTKQYEVTVVAYTHVDVEAESKDEAVEKADDETRVPMDWDVESRRAYEIEDSN
jgi:hypothetical protein